MHRLVDPQRLVVDRPEPIGEPEAPAIEEPRDVERGVELRIGGAVTGRVEEHEPAGARGLHVDVAVADEHDLAPVPALFPQDEIGGRRLGFVRYPMVLSDQTHRWISGWGRVRALHAPS